MVTTAATQNSLVEALKSVVELEYNALEAYNAAIERLKNQEYKNLMQDFANDHERHIQRLRALLAKHNVEAPSDPTTVKQWMTKGKVMAANLISDEAILRAMHSNELDTNTAYERLSERDDIWDDETRSIIAEAYRDEKRHKSSIEQLLAVNA